MAARRVNAGSGSGVATLRERTEAYGTPDLRFLQARVPFVVVGGLATRRYMPERMTLDTDILVLPDDLAAVETALRQANAEKEGPLTVGGSTWRLADGRRLDLLAIEAPWTAAAVQSAVKGPDGLPYIALPYLVVMKLAAGRLQDLADISRMLGAADAVAIKAVVEAVERYCPQDADDLASMIQLGKIEMNRQ